MKLNVPYNNYKTVRCKFFDDATRCRFGKNCTYAHSCDELRQPYEELPAGATTKPGAAAGMALTGSNFVLRVPKFNLTRPDDPIVRQQVLEIYNYL